MLARTRSLLWPALVAMPAVLSMGGTALGAGHGENTPRAASGPAAATVSTAAAPPGCGAHPDDQTVTSGWNAEASADVVKAVAGVEGRHVFVPSLVPLRAVTRGGEVEERYRDSA